MLSSNLLAFCLATAVAALPTLDPRNDEASNITVLPEIDANHVLVSGQNGWEPMSIEAYTAILKENGVSLDAPEVDHEFLAAFDADAANTTESSLEKRQCSNTAMLITRTERFVDWDLQMSPVVIARNRDMTISITQTYTVTDTITVNGGFNPTVITGWLTATVGASVSRSWATATAIAIGGTVSAGSTGAMVVNPWKTRRYGQVLQGCIGSQRVVSTFMSDTFEQGSYNGVRWINGAITLCERRGALNQLPRCHGSGFLS
ncbi:hypothetical protein BS50DRAFT_662231 [Corynespora cassiicola Philippines]|uniref:Uncharacterized protein n=1 Tax=Corynespora cassiicola Philippines TaxID=1448308 RepID=A0A2T2NYG9_CORCC|nr:hypothetical protein BS50DRAFT_662231 [Corynespora cassiicola Philippines]